MLAPDLLAETGLTTCIYLELLMPVFYAAPKEFAGKIGLLIVGCLPGTLTTFFKVAGC